MSARQEIELVTLKRLPVEGNQVNPASTTADSCAASNEYVSTNQNPKTKLADKKPEITGVKMKEIQKFATMLQSKEIKA